MDPKSTTESRALAGPGGCLQRLVFRELLKSRAELQIFDCWHTITSATGIIFGSATFFALLSQANPLYAQYAALVVTIMATIDLVVGISQAARLHDDLSRRFIAIEQQMECAEEPTETLLKELKAGRLEIEAEEPPVLRVLDGLCHNELARAEDWPQGEFVRIRFYQRWLAHFFDIQEHRIQKYKDLQPAWPFPANSSPEIRANILALEPFGLCHSTYGESCRMHTEK